MKETGVKNIVYILLIIAIFSAITIGTFAWLKDRADATRLVLTLGEEDGLTVTLRPYKIEATLSPVDDYTDGEVIEVTADNKSNIDGSFSLYYEINEISEALKSSDFKYRIEKSTDNGVTYTEDESGDFSEATTTDNFDIYEDIVPGNTLYMYKVYIWIQELEEDQSSLQGATFQGNLLAEIDGGEKLPLAPVLDDGMIPVKIANDGTVTVVSPNDDTWYDYDNKLWANAVLVSSTNRTTYKTASNNGTPNVTIPSSDILAYYVWIPRYSYKIWTTGTSSNGSEQEIEINFVNLLTKDTGSTVGSFRTHPAFTFDNRELPGIWVGKFELHNTSGGTNNMSCSNSTCSNSSRIRILPNVVSGRSNTIQSFFYAVASMNMNNNIYGLSTESDTIPHVIKNSEWGAVAYLTQSMYGLNEEVRINNQSGYTTGCGASSANAASNSSCQIAYGGASSYPQSTTGNITGVFDMAGGAGEYVMGNYDNTAKGGFSTLPDSKYYDVYTSSTCTVAMCGGHAINETNSWYGDTMEFVNATNPWFLRGGTYQDTSGAGLFFRQAKDGASSQYRGSRAALVVIPENPKYTVTLNNANATTNGTSQIYFQYLNGVYLDSNYTNLMTTSTNNITIPERTDYIFDGYYYNTKQLISPTGYITSEFTNTLLRGNVTLTAAWVAQVAAPTYTVKYSSNNSNYTPGTWTKDSLYVDISAVSPDLTVSGFQYSADDGETWNNLTCTITNSNNTYSCQANWTTVGNSNVIFRAIDNRNHFTNESSSVNIKYDNVIPTGDVSATYGNNTITATVVVNDSLSGPSNEYGWSVSTSNTCNNTVTFVDNTNSTYTHSVTNPGIYYVCVRIKDGANNINYVSAEIDTNEKVGKPVLTDNLIPITIANNGTVTAVSKDDENWYDYENKIWANAVLTTSTNRSTYQAIANGTGNSTTIPSSEILAYYVWIPRYKYAFTNADGNAESIDIIFEKASDAKATGTATGTSYYTHPAFTFGNKELEGFWVGKFEVSGGADNMGCTSNTCTASNNLRILPNATARRSNTVQSFYYAIASMKQNNNTFGINTDESVDPHMIKGTEWGAIAYLSHSSYGIDGEIRLNNSSAYLTGCGASSANAASSSSCGITYGSTSSYPQSTTGNITGVFDMAGGAGEYTMANFNNNMKSGGFSSLTMDSKYYNIYTSSAVTGCTLAECGGQALNETNGWYTDYTTWGATATPWYVRGGAHNNAANAGIFSYEGKDGGSGAYRGTRAILTTMVINYDTYTITLDNDNATTNGTSQVYLRYTNGVYLDSNFTNKMTSSANNITIPQRTDYMFDGYYSGGTLMIDKNGYITSNFTNTAFNSNTTLNAHWREPSYTATVYYNNNGTVTSQEVTCTIPNNSSECNATIPNAIKNGNGPYSTSYHGLATSTGSMTTAVAANQTTITLSDDGNTYYAVYQTNVTEYLKGTSRTIYRNTYQSNATTYSTVLSTTNIGTSNLTTESYTNNSLTYTWYGYAITDTSDTRTYSTVALAAKSTDNTLYTLYNRNVTVTFYYYDGTSQATTTASGTQISGYDAAPLHNDTVTVPTLVSSSKGPNNASYTGLALTSETTTLTTTINTASASYYAVYGDDLTATFQKANNNVASIGSTELTCSSSYTSNGTTYTGQDCNIILPSITPDTGYYVHGWYNGNTKVGMPLDNYILTGNNTYTAKVGVLSATDFTYDNDYTDVECDDVQCMIDCLRNGNCDEVKPSFYSMLRKNAVMDNVNSTYVQNATPGIKWDEIASDTNGKGIYLRAGTENDAFPIYYYRGAVDNNNVYFGGFCWKIVRTTETGGLKMIYNGIPSSGSCGSGTTSRGGASSTINNSVKFNANRDNAKYVGYTYDNSGTETDSTIKGVVDTWYESNLLTNYDSYLEDTVFCNDRSTHASSEFTSEELSAFSLDSSYTIYGSTYRLAKKTGPSVTCPNTSDAYTKSNTIGNGKLTYPVGLLTSDEIWMAGEGTYAYDNQGTGYKNTTYYLQNNSWWWTMSPDTWDDYFVTGWVVNSSDGLSKGIGVNGTNGARPVVSLKPGQNFEYGNGTVSNPYRFVETVS